MTTAEKVELVLIVGFCGLVYSLSTSFTQALALPRLVLYLAGAFLLQSLIRDLFILLVNRKRSSQAHESECMCVESALGISGVVFGAILFVSGFGSNITLSPIALALTLLVTLLSCFFLKDYVFSWRPWRLYKVKNHLNIVFKFKR